MEAKPSALDNMKDFFKSTNHNGPIEILKRLQREILSDLLKLRDKQDKLEQMLSFTFGKGFQFPEITTQLKAAINVAGACLLYEADLAQAVGSLDRCGTKTGVNTEFIFETVLRHKDTLVTEFTTGQKSSTHVGEVPGNSLALTTLMYSAHVNDWLSVVSSPLGARCTDFRIASKLPEGHSSDGLCSSGPPLFRQHNNCAVGFAFRRPNVAVCLAELISGPEMQQAAAGINRSFTTFGQVMYQPVEDVRITLSGLWKFSRSSSSELLKLGTLALPLGILRQPMSPGLMQASPTASTRRAPETGSAGSIALMLDSEFDESMKIEGWLEVNKSINGSLQCSISVSDIPEHDIGWGLRTGGITKRDLNQFNFEGFLNFNLGKGAKLQPALVCVMGGSSITPALILRSSWFM